METEKTLSPEQIINWRKIIALQLITKAEQMGIDPEGITIWAHIMPDSEVIAYSKKVTQMIKQSIQEEAECLEIEKEIKPRRVIERKPCQHKNSIKGSKGRYCLDCEMYV